MLVVRKQEHYANWKNQSIWWAEDSLKLDLVCPKVMTTCPQSSDLCHTEMHV